jgi:hypothetical protein
MAGGERMQISVIGEEQRYRGVEAATVVAEDAPEIRPATDIALRIASESSPPLNVTPM